MILRLRPHRIHADEPPSRVAADRLPRCAPVAGSILTLEVTYTQRPIQRLLERGLLELGFKSRTWQTGPRSYRSRFEGEWSDDAIDLIRAAMPAIGAVHEIAHHPV